MMFTQPKRARFKAPQLRKREGRAADEEFVTLLVPWQSTRKFVVFVESCLTDRSISTRERSGLERCLADLRASR